MLNTKNIGTAVLLLASMAVYAASGQGPAGEGAADAGSMKERMGKPMARFDTNGDGVVSAEEIAEHRQSRFSEIDADGDGFITDAEHDAYKEKLRKQRGLVARADSDGDGKVSAEEFAAQSDKMLARLDKDGDGNIERGEMRRHHGRGDCDGKGGKRGKGDKDS